MIILGNINLGAPSSGGSVLGTIGWFLTKVPVPKTGGIKSIPWYGYFRYPKMGHRDRVVVDNAVNERSPVSFKMFVSFY